ncbi:hypothetical protein OBP_169 [Pseudomonas phage OBP]|uniref:hypothetical protein n=1 Tax=Pseudomonas phage OBP TaxID=1124849 RepID=UPI000240D589|nr:hypothetical protein OBP_169 [Pseudomonas phage OBP]AEV89606.1 hypothetical protein OBP_169 [Pseudomonas phage OBP]
MSKQIWNHSPFVHSEWVEFTGLRFKNPYMLRLKDGRELPGYPNAGAWAVEYNAWIEDSEVTHIMPLPDNYPGLGRQMPGGFRIARDIEYFGKRYPVWCGTKDGFVRENQIPKGKEILPIRIMAYRDKKDTTKKVHLFVTQGLLVDIHPSNVSLESMQKYTEVPGFWPDDDVQVLSCDELVHCINNAAVYKQLESTEPLVPEITKYLREVIGLTPQRYLPLFGFVVTQWKKDKEDFCRQLEMGMIVQDKVKDRMEQWRILEKPKLTKTARAKLINLSRGPEVDKTFTIEMLEISNFLKNPLILPPVKWEGASRVFNPAHYLNSPGQ